MSISNNIEIKYEAPELPLICQTDPQEIEQIIINLMINSSHAVEDINSPQIYIELTDDEETVICKIGDNGMGIHDDILKKSGNHSLLQNHLAKGLDSDWQSVDKSYNRTKVPWNTQVSLEMGQNLL